MINRLLGLWRDAWWLLVVLLAAGLFVGFLLSWAFAVAIWGVVLFSFGYFAIMRYDDAGRERANQ